jgi:hypothetical protein
LKNADAFTVTVVDEEGGGAVEAAIGTYDLTASDAVFSVGSAGNYSITYNNPGTLTVCSPLDLVAAAEVQVDKQGPIGTAQTTLPIAYPPITYARDGGYLDGNLFTIGATSGELTFASPMDNNVGDVYYVRITATDDNSNSGSMLVKVTVVETATTGTLFLFR